MVCSFRFAAGMVLVSAIGAVGCASSTQGVDKERAAEGMATAEWQMRQFQQQPRSNPEDEKLVYPQPVEDPLNAGRDLEPGTQRRGVAD